MQEPRKPETCVRAYFLPRWLNINKAHTSSNAVLLAGGSLTVTAVALPLLPGFTGVSLQLDMEGGLQTSVLALTVWNG